MKADDRMKKDDIRWVSRVCPGCGKTFETIGIEWGYKAEKCGDKYNVYVCSYKCLRKIERDEEQKRKEKQ